MKKSICSGIVLLAVLGSGALVSAGISETQKARGGQGLQNVHDRILCGWVQSIPNNCVGPQKRWWCSSLQHPTDG
jgi:hypothetical protein